VCLHSTIEHRTACRSLPCIFTTTAIAAAPVTAPIAAWSTAGARGLAARRAFGFDGSGGIIADGGAGRGLRLLR